MQASLEFGVFYFQDGDFRFVCDYMDMDMDMDAWSKVPAHVSHSAITSNTFSRSIGKRSIPSSYYIDDKYLPEAGNQGQYGTCTAWAVGYGAMSIMQAVKTGESPTTDDKLFSPKHLFWNIPDNKKGDEEDICNGADIIDAWEQIQNNGIAPLSEVPYPNPPYGHPYGVLESCAYDLSFESQYESVASNYKIENYRRIELGKLDPAEAEKKIKYEISNNIPVVIGARLGDKFTSDFARDYVYNSDTYNNPNREHAWHAMVVIGYNESSYKVLNSWGNDWEDNGYVWVGKDFFHTYPYDSYGYAREGFAAVAAVAKSIPSTEIIDVGIDLVATLLKIDCDTSGNCTGI